MLARVGGEEFAVLVPAALDGARYVAERIRTAIEGHKFVVDQKPIPVTMTVGRAEENAENNRNMARALAEQGYDVSLEEVADMHNYVGWRDAFDPHLTALLQRAWKPR